jgi:hypothetical protein
VATRSCRGDRPNSGSLLCRVKSSLLSASMGCRSEDFRTAIVFQLSIPTLSNKGKAAACSGAAKKPATYQSLRSQQGTVELEFETIESGNVAQTLSPQNRFSTALVITGPKVTGAAMSVTTTSKLTTPEATNWDGHDSFPLWAGANWFKTFVARASRSRERCGWSPSHGRP